MTKRNRKGPSTALIVGLLVLSALGIAGVAKYVTSPEASKVPPELRAGSGTDVASKKDDPSGTTVLTPKMHGEDLTYKETKEGAPKGQDPVVFAVNRFLEETTFVPKKARALAVQIKDKVALIDFTPEFQTSYGSDDERVVLNGLCKAVGQFPNVDKVQFFVDAKPVDSLGNVDLSQPLNVIRPGQEVDATKPGGSQEIQEKG